MCCGKASNQISIPSKQQELIKAIKENLKPGSSVVKSNRSRPGMIAKECPICGTKTVVNYCPICSYKF
jgi:sensor histidine kinase regulating citrate/malate metabolism